MKNYTELQDYLKSINTYNGVKVYTECFYMPLAKSNEDETLVKFIATWYKKKLMGSWATFVILDTTDGRNNQVENQQKIKDDNRYFNTKDVLRLITEALSAKNESLEERVIRLMPESVKPIWNQLNENSRKSILSQARLYPGESLMNESQIEYFWMTRNLKKNESVTKKLVSHESLIQEDKISDGELNAIMERFKTYNLQSR